MFSKLLNAVSDCGNGHGFIWGWLSKSFKYENQPVSFSPPFNLLYSFSRYLALYWAITVLSPSPVTDTFRFSCKCANPDQAEKPAPPKA